MSITITLSADRAIFSNDAIKTSNDNLGVQIFENGQLVKPGGIQYIRNRSRVSAAASLSLY